MLSKKHIVIFMALLVFCMSVAVAADTNDTASVNSDVADTVEVDTSNVQTQTVASVREDNNQKIVKESKTVKNDENDPVLVTTSTQFDDLFEDVSTNIHQIKSEYTGKTIKINTDITKNEQSYIINILITLTSDNNNTIDLNTSNGYENTIIPRWTSINFTSGASGSRISNMQFYNTQIFVKGANDIEFYNNTLNNGASFSGAQCSLVAGNTFTGTVTIAKNSTVKNNIFYKTATINQNSDIIDNQFNGTVTIKKYSNVKDNIFNDTVTINEYSNVTNNIFRSDVILKNNVNFKNNNAENSTVYVIGANCDLCGNRINTLVISAYPVYVCRDNIFTNYPTDPNISWYFHGSRNSNLDKNYLRSVKTSSVTEGIEYEEIDIDDEETFLKYFRYQEQGEAWLPLGTHITGNTRFKLGYFPEKGKLFYLMLPVYGQYMDSHFSIVGKNNLTLNNVGFYVVGTHCSISNFNLVYDLEDETDNIQPVACQDFGMSGCYIEFDNLNITLNCEYGTINTVFGTTKSNNLGNIILQNSTINVKCPASSFAVISNNAENTKILNNIINIEEKYNVGDNPYIIGIYGDVNSTLNHNSNNVTCINNIINMNGESTLIAIKIGGNTNTITNNNITVTTTGTANGVELTGNDNIVKNNKISANDKTGNDAVTATGENNIVENNTASEADTRIPTSIELNYDGTPIDVGQQLVIRGAFKAGKDETGAEDIKVYDNNELIATINTIDEFGTITYAYIPTVSGSHNITFAFEGNDTCKNTSTTITVEVNEVIEPTKEYTLKVDTTEFTQGETTTITASIYYGDENEQEIATNISKGKISFKVNGKTLKDANGKVIYAKVVNGTATIENYPIPESWKEGSTIQAVYSGSTDLEKMSSEKTEITITTTEPTITTEDITTQAGAIITLKATINTDVTINTGKIVFKINGKTVKDTNGKVIYAKVSNNEVTVEYTLPEEYTTGTYNITAVFISPDYERLEDTKTLTITA